MSTLSTMKYSHSIQGLKILGLGVLLLLAIFPLAAAAQGDYQTKWGGTWNTLSLWQTYNGSQWVDATALPTSPFYGTINIKHYISIDRPLQLAGSAAMVITNQLQVYPGCNLEIGPNARIEFKEVRITNGGVITNNGYMLANRNSSSITIEAGGTLRNNAVISSMTSAKTALNLLSAGNLEFGNQGIFNGQGSFSVGYNANIATANPLGIDGSIAVNGNKNYDRANYLFNGSEHQITGLTMHPNVLSVSIENNQGVQLSTNVNVVNVFKVNTGASLELGLNIINKAWHGVGTFTLSPGANVTTAHPDGIHSTGDVGSVRVTYRNYSSDADYTYNGNAQQQTGNFVTTPDNDPTDGQTPIAHLNILNPNGVTVTVPLEVNKNITVLEGTAEGEVKIVGSESKIDGLFSYNYYHSFTPNGVVINDYIPYTDVNNAKPLAIKRRWNIRGNFTGTKSITFYWEPEEDNGINWAISTPVIERGNQKIYAEAWDTTSSPRWATTTISDLNDRAMFTITGGEEQTLSVVLSSFNALSVHNSGVRLQWSTQSESGLSVYYIWRADSNDLATAIPVSSLQAAENSSNYCSYVYTDNNAEAGNTYWYWLQSVDYDGAETFYGSVRVHFDSGNNNAIHELPNINGLLSPYPNPFNPSVSIAFTLAKPGKAEVMIYNQRGQAVRKLYSGTAKAGRNSLIWDGTDESGKPCGSGAYLFIMETAGERFVKKATMVK